MIGYIFEYYKYLRYTKNSLDDLNALGNNQNVNKTYLTFGEFDRLKVNRITDISRFRDLSELARSWQGNRQSLLFYTLENDPAYTYIETEDEFGFFNNESGKFDDHLFIGLTEFPFTNQVRDEMTDYKRKIDNVRNLITVTIDNLLKEKDVDLSYMVMGNMGTFGISVLWFSNQYADILKSVNCIKAALPHYFLSAYTILSRNPRGNENLFSEIKGRAFVQITLKKHFSEGKFDVTTDSLHEIIKNVYHTQGQYDIILEVDANKAFTLFDDQSMFKHIEASYQREILQTNVIFGEEIDVQVQNSNVTVSNSERQKVGDSRPDDNDEKSEINQISDEIRSQLKKISYKSSGVVDTFDSLLCDYRYNAVSAVNQHWADDFTHIFLKSLNCIEDMIEFMQEDLYDIEFMSILREVMDVLKQQIFHMAESNSLNFEIPKCHLRYTGQEDSVLFCYINIIKETLEEAYSLEGTNSQTEIVPIVTVDSVPIVESNLYFDKTEFYKENFRDTVQKCKLLAINLPHISFYDIPTYFQYLYHEIYHYIVPENREKRDFYTGQFLSTIFYEEIISELLKRVLENTESWRRTKEYLYPEIITVVADKYEYIDQKIKRKHKINRDTDNDSVFFVAEIYQRCLYEYLEKDICNWIEGKDSDFREILNRIDQDLQDGKNTSKAVNCSYEDLKLCYRNNGLREDYEKDVERFMRGERRDKYNWEIILSLLPDIRKMMTELSDGLKETVADLAMIELTDMKLEEYMSLYIECQENLMMKAEKFDTVQTREYFRIGMVLKYYEEIRKQILDDKLKDSFRVQYFAKNITIHHEISKETLKRAFSKNEMKLDGWWNTFIKVQDLSKETFFDMHRVMLRKICDEIRVSQRLSQDRNRKNKKVKFYTYKKIISDYGETLLQVRKVLENSCEEAVNMYECAVKKFDASIFIENIRLMQKYQKGKTLIELSKINLDNNKIKKERQNKNLYCTHTKLEAVKTQFIINISSAQNENYVEEYSTKVFDINGLMYEFEKITKKLKESCTDVLPQEKYSLWYRGQMNSNYELLPSIMRANVFERSNFTYLAQYQRYLFEKFKYRADGAPEIMDRSVFSTSDYLALMQHYNVRTNFMDWSEDAFASLYFALEKLINGEISSAANHPSIQIFSPNLYNRARTQMINEGMIQLPEDEEVFRASVKTTGSREGEIPNIATVYNEKIFDMFLLGNVKYEKTNSYGHTRQIVLSGGKEMAFLPLAIYTSKLNPRIRAQSGLFLAYNLYAEPSLNGDYDYLSLERIQDYYLKWSKAHNKKQFLYKIVIDRPDARAIADCFISLGLAKERVYPELMNVGEKIR